MGCKEGGDPLGMLRRLLTGRPARIESYRDAEGPIAAFLDERGVGAGVGSPIVVDGSLWGLVAVLSTGPVSLPPDTEPRLAEFTEPLEISDDGVGGADLSNGTGLLGLRDRVEALGGSLVMKSPAGEGTSVLVRLPVDPA